jgi:hypothetical protein
VASGCNADIRMCSPHLRGGRGKSLTQRRRMSWRHTATVTTNRWWSGGYHCVDNAGFRLLPTWPLAQRRSIRRKVGLLLGPIRPLSQGPLEKDLLRASNTTPTSTHCTVPVRKLPIYHVEKHYYLERANGSAMGTPFGSNHRDHGTRAEPLRTDGESL